jgi:hypothetical protein
MGPEAISLSVRSNGHEGSYRFTCPNCEDDVEKRADRKILALLVSAGVDIDRHDGERPFAPELFDDEDLESLGSSQRSRWTTSSSSTTSSRTTHTSANSSPAAAAEARPRLGRLTR